MIIFMGVAGSGKSVQGKLLAGDLGCLWFSTGEMLRQRVSGKRLKEMLEGKLLGDQEIIGMIDEYINDSGSDTQTVVDGFPRTLPQAEWLIKQSSDNKINIAGVVHIQASEEVVKKRLLQRGRPDDNKQAITKRFEEYKNSTLPILKRLAEENIPVFDVSGEGEIADVHQSILKFFKEKAVS